MDKIFLAIFEGTYDGKPLIKKRVEISPAFEKKIAQDLVDEWAKNDYNLSAIQTVEFVIQKLKNSVKGKD